MAEGQEPGSPGRTGPPGRKDANARDEDLERRRRELEASLASRLPGRSEREETAKAGRTTGYGQAFKLSSEFIAGIVVGVGIGWMVDRMAGTSPWGLVVFLLLGFGAGILNVLRMVGRVADPRGPGGPPSGGEK